MPEYGSQGFYSCCGGEVYSNGHTNDCPTKPGCCGKCRFACLITNKPGEMRDKR